VSRTVFCVLLSAFCLLACHREQRDLVPTARDARRVGAAGLVNPYEGNAYAISQGQRLYEQYNCSGCHSHGGGGIGPALMDDEWIYGSSPANIYTSIAEGRPNGMPSWGGHIPDYQIWELVTYVRAVGGFEGRVATGSRADEMQARRAEEPKP
jgi:cytochrome c oxidase cbb3-type subunit 3